jgi:methyl-accepting chemotaxis protein
MRNWKISTRIASGFGLVIAIAMSLGSFAYIRIGDIDNNSTRITDHTLPGLYLAGQVQSGVQKNYATLLELLSSADKQEIVSLENEIQRARAVNTDTFAEYEKTILSEKGRELFENLKTARAAYTVVFEGVLSLKKAGKDKEAAALLRDQLKPAHARYMEAAANVAAYRKSSADEDGRAISATVNLSRGGILIGLTLAVICASVVAVLMVRSVARPLAVAVGMLEQVAQGDLTRVAEVHSTDELGRMLAALNGMVGNLRRTVSQVTKSADSVASGSEEMSSTAQQLSQGTTEQAAAAEESTSAMEEMAASIQQNADGAKQTDKLASKAAEDALASGNAVNQTVTAMKEIAGKINIIEEIARKTDLLALNAAVEAARAGDHGKGFAVVASEVRKLAERSQIAAAEISQLSASGVQMAEGAGKLLEKLVPDIRKTAELVREIAVSSAEQNTGATQVNKAIQQLDQVIQENSSASEEMASSAEELSEQAQRLQSAIAFFKVSEEDSQAANSQRTSAAPAAPQRKTAVRRDLAQAADGIAQRRARSGKSNGATIELGAQSGGNDSRDNEFSPYQA